MKVAVISSHPQAGKSTLNVVLGCIFASTQGRSTTILSTGRMDDVLSMIKMRKDKSVSNSVSVLEAVLATGAVRGEEIFDYGFPVGDSKCYAFDVYDSTYDKEQLDKMLLQTMTKVKSDLMLIEVKGDLNDGVNSTVLEMVDAVLYLFTTSRASILSVCDYKKSFPREITAKTGFVCSKFDQKVSSDKQMAKEFGIDIKNLMHFPYNAAIAKEALLGRLDTTIKFIESGDDEVVKLRPKLVEIMQYLFDSARVKYIRDVDKWSRD